MAQTVTCAKSGYFARCIVAKLRCKSYTVGPFQRNYSSKTQDKTDVKNLPKHPKKPVTPYLEFYVSHLDDIRKNNTDLKSAAGWAKVSAQMWKDLDSEEKEMYESRYKERLAAYSDEVKHFNDSLTEKQKLALKEHAAQEKMTKEIKKEKKIKKQKMKEFHMPKKPKSAFACYISKASSNRPKDVKMADYFKQLGDQWKGMTDQEKKPYLAEAELEKEQYEEKISDWVQQMLEEGNGEEVDKELLKKELQKLGKPKPPKQAYLCYLTSNKIHITDKKENHWKELTPEEKEPYLVLAEEDKERYKSEMMEWRENMDTLGKEDFVLEAELLIRKRKKMAEKSKKGSTKTPEEEEHDISDSDSDSD